MLTNLYNRNRYMEVLDSYQHETAVNTGVAYIDLNGLKKLNDQKGHEAGDKLIKDSAALIAEIFPEQAYRIGGDEFVIIASGISEQGFFDKLKLLREKMHTANISFSAGAIWHSTIDDMEAVLKTADMYMYKEKEAYHRNGQ